MASIQPNNSSDLGQFDAHFDYYESKLLKALSCSKRGLFDDAVSTICELQRELPCSNEVAKVAAYILEEMRMKAQAPQIIHHPKQEAKPTAAHITAKPLDTQNPPSIEEIMNSEPLFRAHWKELIKRRDFHNLKDKNGYTFLHKVLYWFFIKDCRTIFAAAMPLLEKHPELLDAKSLAGETLMYSAANARGNFPNSSRAKVALLEQTYKQLKQEPNVVEKPPDFVKTEEAQGAPTPLSNSDVSPKTLLDPKLEYELFGQYLETDPFSLPATPPSFL